MIKSILYIVSIFLILISITSCDNTIEILEKKREVAILPIPKQLYHTDKSIALSKSSALYSPDSEVQALLELLSDDIYKLSGTKLNITSADNNSADIVFSIDKHLSDEQYVINSTERIDVSGGSYNALVQAKSALLQLITIEENKIVLPQIKLSDHPDIGYRGLMVDLARQWHTVETIKKIIDMCSFYKINYLQLHFTDYQSYTLPSRAYPLLSTQGRTYSFEQLEELEDYSQLRGVTIIPEIDVPGHSSPFIKKYPKIFAIQDTINNPWIINMGKDEVYHALEKIIAEAVTIFKSSPYFHIGGDEAIFTSVTKDPYVKSYMKEHNLGTDVHELYRHFLIRMNDIVKKQGKQMCVWEGFRSEGKLPIPKDIIVYEFETNRYLPGDLVADGYQVVNTSWKPIYVVNKKKWEPKTIYDWNIYQWSNWWPKAPSYNPIQIEKTPLVVGAQMCAWEQSDEVEIPSLRKRLPVYLERIWNTEKKVSYEEMMNRLSKTDDILSKLINDDRQDNLLIGHNHVFVEPTN